ncbi:hypothetical protein ACFVDT_09025 [Streptomyces sp. NPDC057699]|uniref:LppU/SCO3897 family protein n=1 Tax=Streptomyces TaxID=1883 RepID=UPI00100DABFD|nr:MULTISPECIES: hypothetical protein [Streptomyces]MBL1289193.1 hypothetical protein [Streptomyces silvae]
MSLPEIPLSLTPMQAADGAVVTVPLPTGPTRVHLPPVQDGDLARIRIDGQEVLLRIRVARRGSPLGRAWPGLLGIAAVIALAVILATGLDHDSTPSRPSAASSSSFDPYIDDPYAEDTSTEDPYTEEPAAAETEDDETEETEDPATEDPYTEDPYDTDDEAAPEPYENGTCLNGTLPDSTTAQEVSGVDEVSCSASDAHYQVIQRFSFTSDMSRCEANSATQYAFSYRYTLNGTAINEYVYCLIGLGSYAR